MQTVEQFTDDFKVNQADAIAHGFISPGKNIVTFCTKNDILLLNEK